MIIFTKVRWKNFLATGNSFLELNLNETNKTIFLGKSGSGKSTLLDVISFVLFNKPFRMINKPQLVNAINGKECLVEIEFQISNNEYLIRRGIKPNIFEIFRNGKLLNQDAANKDYQKYLEKTILKFNYKSFTQIVVLGASNFTPFMKLKPQERRIIIEELLNLEIFSSMNLVLKEKISNNKKSIIDSESNEEILNEKIKLRQKYISDLLKDKKDKVSELEGTIETNRVALLENENQTKDIKLKCDKLELELKASETITNQITKLLEIEKKLERERKVKEKEIKFYDTNDNCPTCKQDICAEFKVKELKEKKEKVEEILSGIEVAEKKIQKLSDDKSKFDKVKVKLQELNSEISKLQSTNSGIETFIKKIEGELSKLKQPKNAIKEENEILKSLKLDLVSLEEERVELYKKKAIYSTTLDILKDSGVKSRILKQYLPLINKYTNKFLSEMDFFAEFHIDENFNEEIKSRGRDTFSYGNFSEGEKQRIDLSLLFTWRTIAKLKNSINTNLLILDEIFDSYLDIEATESVIDVLNSSLFANTNMIVISHKNNISDKFDKTINFKMNRGFTEIS